MEGRMSWWEEFKKWDITISNVTIDDYQIEEEFHSIDELWTFLKGYFYGKERKK